MLVSADYQRAIQVQDACNSCGIIQSLAEVVQRIDGGTSERNQHPIVRMYISKLADLAGMDHEGQSEAYRICKERSTIKEPTI